MAASPRPAAGWEPRAISRNRAGASIVARSRVEPQDLEITIDQDALEYRACGACRRRRAPRVRGSNPYGPHFKRRIELPEATAELSRRSS